MNRIRSLLVLLALSLGPAGLAGAQQTTGSISGTVFDQNGAPVGGATIDVKGDRLPAGRTATTSDAGRYQFPLLQPGSYTVTADKAGAGTSSRAVLVEVGKDSQLEIILGVKVEENIQVSAAAPDVDLKSTEVNFNFKADEIKALPLKRTYAGLFQLIPGVADNNSFAPNAGASRQDNVFLLDGVNITNPGFGYLSTDVNEFDIIEFNIKRGGITAEFGRASGFVANAVTRSGTNAFHGGARFEAIPSTFVGDAKGPIQDKTSDYNTALSIGGPILKDRLFFYGSGMFLSSTLTDRINNLGPVPDRKNNTKEGFGKVNAQLSPQHQFDVGFRIRPITIDNASIGVNDAPSTATNQENQNRVISANYNWFMGPRTYLDVKFLRLDEQGEAVALQDLGFQPAFNVNAVDTVGQYTRDGRTVGSNQFSLNRANYYRNEVRARISHLLDIGSTQHQIKAGFGWEDSQEDLTRLSNGWGAINRVNNNTQYSAVYYPRQPAQLGKGRTYSLFVQDDITINSRLVANIGLLLNRDEFAQQIGDTKNTFLTFGFGSEIQPRLGVNYLLRKDKGDKIYANFGRYYALDQKSTSRSLAPNRLFTSEAIFDAVTGALISDRPTADTTGKVIAPDLDAPYTNEYLVGYATPLGGPWSLDAFFIYRDANAFIEDVPTVLPFSSFVYMNIPEADRRYRAFTLELNRRMANRWSLNASYAYSKLYGNFDLDYGGETTLFNTSSLLEDGPGSFVEDRFRYGPLSQDRTHVMKLFATYMPIDRVTIGGYLRAQSGVPWEARGLPWGSVATYLRYLEPAGTHRSDAWTNFDLLANYRLPLGGRAGVTLEARVLNLFDTQTGLTVDKRQYLDGRIRAFTTPPGADCGRACYTDLMVQGTTQPNPEFGNPLTYAPARRLYLTAKLEF